MRRDFESTKYEKICGAKKVKKIPPRTCVGDLSFLYALSTLPDLRQEVQTYIFLAPPLAVLTFYIGFPHFIGSSMGMTYIISEMSTFFANCALSHDSTSLTLFFNRFYFNR